MTTTIEGKNVLLDVWNGFEFIPYLCATDMTISIKPELISVMTVDDGRYPRKKVRRMDWSIAFSGIVSTASDTTAFHVFDMLHPANILLYRLIRVAFTDRDGNSKTFTGAVMTEGLDLAAAADDFSTFEHGLTGNGPYTINSEIIAPPEFGGTSSVLINAATTSPTIQDDVLIGEIVLGVNRAGRWYAVITVGTPSNTEVKFNSPTGELTFSEAMDIGEQTFVIYK